MEALRRTRTLWSALVALGGGYITLAQAVAGNTGFAISAVLCSAGLILPWYVENTKFMRRLVYFWIFGVTSTMVVSNWGRGTEMAVFTMFGGAGLIVAAVAWIFKRL